MKPRHFLALLILLSWMSWPCVAVSADEPKAAPASSGSADAAKAKLKVQTMLSDLDRPCGVAVRPETEYVYIAENGAGQIVKFAPARAGKTAPSIVGFPVDPPASADSPAGGLWCMAFLGRNALATVSTAVKDDKQEATLSVFDLPTVGSAAEEQPLKYDGAGRRATPLLTGAQEKTGEAGSFNVALFDFSAPALMIAAKRSDEKAGIYKADLGKNHDSVDAVRQLIKAGAANKSPNFQCLGVSPHGLLVAVQVAADAQHQDSALAFYQLRTGNLLMSMPLALADIVALAYSPESGRLYALRCAVDGKSTDDGLYRLDAGKIEDHAGAVAVKIAPIEHPTALTFAADNTLYVTALGADVENLKSDAPSKSGKLLKITGEL